MVWAGEEEELKAMAKVSELEDEGGGREGEGGIQ